MTADPIVAELERESPWWGAFEREMLDLARSEAMKKGPAWTAMVLGDILLEGDGR